jgi:hypothetical protein
MQWEPIWLRGVSRAWCCLAPDISNPERGNPAHTAGAENHFRTAARPPGREVRTAVIVHSSSTVARENASIQNAPMRLFKMRLFKT